jgi:hypothetical protein
VKAHGGEIMLHEKENQGTEFTIILPAQTGVFVFNFSSFYRGHQIFGSNDLPFIVSEQPGVCPDKTTRQWFPGITNPCFISLRHSHVAIEANLYIIKVI